MEHVIRSLRPDRVVFDAGSTHWRGATLIGVAGDVATLRALVEHHLWQTLQCDATLLPPGALRGCPLAVRVEGSAYTIVEIIGSHWPGDGSPGTDESGAVDRALAGEGPWFVGVVPRHIHREPATWWTT